MTTGAHELAKLLRLQFGLHELVPLLYRLLAAGRPVTVEQAAAAGGWTPGQVRAELDRHPGVDWDDEGRVVGFGLTLRPTPHRFVFTEATDADGADGGGDRLVFGFCASDALLFPVVLGRAGVIESTCPATGRPIRVHVDPEAVTRVDPAQAVVTRIRPEHAVADVRAQICSLGNFFSSAEAASGWLGNTPHGTVVPVADDFETTRLAAEEVGWIRLARRLG